MRLLTSSSRGTRPIQRAAYVTVKGFSAKITDVKFDKRPSGFRAAVYEKLGFEKGATPRGMNVCHVDPWSGFTARVRQELIGRTLRQAMTFINTRGEYTQYPETKCADDSQAEIQRAIWQYCLDKYNDPDNVKLDNASTNKSMGSISRKAKSLFQAHLDGTIQYPIRVRLPKAAWTTVTDYDSLKEWGLKVGIDADDDLEVEELEQAYETAGCVIL